MYRAYPEPQSGGTITRNPNASTADAHNNTINDNDNDGKAKTGSRSIRNSNNGNLNRSRIPLPGSTIPKFGSPSRSLPPPTKKHRAGALYPPQSPVAAAGSSPAPPSNSFVDDKIAQRRAQLQSLKSQSVNSNASAILARAKAVTTAKAKANTTTNANANANAKPPPLATATIPSTTHSFHRSRPIALQSAVRSVPAKVAVAETKGVVLDLPQSNNIGKMNINGNTHMNGNGNVPPRTAKNGTTPPAPTAAPAAVEPTKQMTPTVPLSSPSLLKNTSKEPEVTSSKRRTLQALRQAAVSHPKQMNMNTIHPLTNDTKATPLPLADGMGENATVTKLVPLAKKEKEDNTKVVETDADANVDVDAVVTKEEKQPMQSSQLNLTTRLRKAQEEKTQAMKRMAELESQVMEMRFQNQSQFSTRNGRSMERDERGVGSSSSRGGRRRIKSPEPRRLGRDPLKDLNVASKAVETVEEIFQSSSAKFVVRKPYGGNELNDYWFGDELEGHGDSHRDGHGHGVCSIEWMESVEGYWTKASVKDEKSLEVLANIDADGSILHIYGNSCRHGLPIIGDNGVVTGYEFKMFKDVEYMDGALGKVIFIDGEGNDEEYWLDPIYEEALKIRESYCSNVFSAALALSASEADMPTADSVTNGQGPGSSQVDNVPPTMMMPPVSTPPVVADACVDTNDLPQDPSVQKPVEEYRDTGKEQSAQVKPSPPVQKQQKTEQLGQPHQPQHEDSGSTDILSYFFITFFSTIFSLIRFILMIPVRVVRFTFTVGVVVCVVNLLWLYFADNRNAMDMGAIMSRQFNIN